MRVGRYEIVRELGRGGMARVHLARQLDLDRFAALKELGSLQREDAELAARFVRESRVAGALNHTCIVTVLDFFEHEGTPYIAMEYVPRGSLRPWVGRLSLAQIGGVLESVLSGLAHAHNHGVVHRDLKPENLMVTDEGRVKITDFGIAKALSGAATAAFRTATGATLGTPAYMAPEQAMGEGIGPSTDLYAVGVIAYELLAGSVPFSNAEPVALLFAHLQKAPPPLSERAPAVPEPIAGWVHRLLAKAPADRPESARSAWEELEEHLLECIGPRWRRTARIEGDPSEAGAKTPSGRPLTPAEFASGEVEWRTFHDPQPVSPATERAAWSSAPAPSDGAGQLPTTRGESWPPPPATAADPAPATEPPPRGESSPDASPTRAPSAADGTATAQLPRTRRRVRALAIGGGVLATAVAAAAVALSLAGGDGKPAPATRAGSTNGDAPRPAGSAAAPLGDQWLRTVHIASYDPDGYAKPAFVDALRRAKADGATHVVLHPLLAVPSNRSSKLRVRDDGPTDETLATGLQVARREGLETIIQPYLEAPDSYAGAYDPSDPDAFFTAYAERIGAYADIAGRQRAYGVVVGSVLSQLDGPDHTDRWSALLVDARRRCRCQVSYMAENLDGAEHVQFWDATDAIAVATYEPLTDEPTTDVPALTRAWTPVKRRLQALNARWNKPVLIADLAYQSASDQAASGTYEASGKPSETAQAALYEAAFRAFHGTPWFGGIAWTELNGDGQQPESDDYQFAGKRAEDILRAWQTAT